MVEGIRILHVDDDLDFADVTAAYLEGEDDQFTVETAHSASEGLDRLSADVDCIVSDFDLPGMNGIEFLDTVREDYPDRPFILFTGKGSETVASDAISAGVTDYLQKRPGTDQYVLLANRIRNAVDQYRANQRAATLGRIRSLVDDVNGALVRADSRAEIETEVCEILTDSDPYAGAWIGDVDGARVVPRTGAGVAGDSLPAFTVPEETTDRGPVGRAVRNHDVAVSDDDRDRPGVVPSTSTVRTMATVPVVYDGTLLGVLAVYAEQADAFDETERSLLVELGTDIAHAFHSLRMKAELERRNDLFRKAQDLADVGAWEYDARTGDLFWTDEVYEIHDLPGDVALDPEAAIDFYHPEDRATIREAFERAVEEGEPYDLELRLVTASDDERWVRTRGDPQFVDDSLVRVRGTFQDITARREREQELREKGNLLEQLFEQAPSHIYVKDTEGRYLYVSEFYVGEEHDWIADDTETILGRTDLDFEEGVGSEAFADDMRVIETGEPIIDKEEYDPQFDNWFLTSKVPWYGPDGDVSGLIGVTRRITDRKKSELELERKNEQLEEFASVVSHDLRNPLNVAQGRLELAREECASDHLATVADAHDRMDTLINDLLTLAREGDRVRETEAVDLSTTAARCWETVTTADATLVTETDQAIRGDPNRLQQLLENLLRNAVEHGGENVTITIGDLHDDTGFYVADDGPGIPADDRERVFETGYSTSDDGTGFGLNIVREVAEAHDWSVRVTDSDAGGTRFEFTGVEHDDV